MLRCRMLAKNSELVARILLVIRGGAGRRGKAGGFASKLQGDVGGWIGDSVRGGLAG